jgi:hypothetical protein
MTMGRRGKQASVAIGAAAMTYGLYLAWPPGGWIFGGFALLAFGLNTRTANSFAAGSGTTTSYGTPREQPSRQTRGTRSAYDVGGGQDRFKH